MFAKTVSKTLTSVIVTLKMTNNTETYYVVNEREVAKQEILAKIQELKAMDSMSYLTGIIALQLVEVFIKFMDEE